MHGMAHAARPDFATLEAELTARGATHVVSDKTLGSYKMAAFWQSNPSLRVPRLGLNMVGGPNATNVVRQLG